MDDVAADPVETARILAFEHYSDIHGMDYQSRECQIRLEAFELGLAQLVQEATDAGVEDPYRAVHEAAQIGRCEAWHEHGLDEMGRPLPPPDDDPILECPEDDVPPPGDADCPFSAGDGDSWRSRLLMTSGDNPWPRSCGSNAVAFVRHHPSLVGLVAYDERTGHPVWASPPPWDPGAAGRQLRDADADELSLWLAEVERVAMGREHCWRALCAEAERHPIDRLRDWLEGVRWDGVQRLSSWIVRLCRAEDTPYIQSITRAWMISAVARTFRPGVQADHMLVLEGPQGTGKTSTIRELAGDEWYAEVSISGESKDLVQAVQGPWICEWSELSGIGRREAEGVKAFVSRRIDHYRPPYGRATVDSPRRCVFAGSTNDQAWQTDPTGGRRYWPIRAGQCEPGCVAAEREQLWAEAVVAYRAGEEWWIGPAGAKEVREQQDARYEGDPWEERIAVAVAGRVSVTLSEVVAALELPTSAQGSGTGRRVARIMDRLHWRQSRRRDDAGRQFRVYENPIAEDDGKKRQRCLRGI